jgi:hypothetical protein
MCTHTTPWLCFGRNPEALANAGTWFTCATKDGGPDDDPA